MLTELIEKSPRSRIAVWDFESQRFDCGYIPNDGDGTMIYLYLMQEKRYRCQCCGADKPDGYMVLEAHRAF